MTHSLAGPSRCPWVSPHQTFFGKASVAHRAAAASTSGTLEPQWTTNQVLLSVLVCSADPQSRGWWPSLATEGTALTCAPTQRGQRSPVRLQFSRKHRAAPVPGPVPVPLPLPLPPTPGQLLLVPEGLESPPPRSPPSDFPPSSPPHVHLERSPSWDSPHRYSHFRARPPQ